MRRIALAATLMVGSVLQAQTPNWQHIQGLDTLGAVHGQPVTQGCAAPALPGPDKTDDRAAFASDRAFPNFIGPISNPILTKDPRSLTELRPLFIQNSFPGSNPVLRGGDAQIYAAQARVALTDRLTFIADKDGIASLSSKGLPHQTGFLDVAAGLKYTAIRDVENQFLAAVGFMYELPTGEAKVFQGRGPGLFTGFLSAGKEFGDFHVLGNVGYVFGNPNYYSQYFYSQIHVDKQMFGWLYPLVELNWFRYTSGSNALPRILGEGDGLINFGTNGMSGRNIVTMAFGLKAMVSRCVEVGAAYEVPLSDRRDIIGNRFLVELILRY